MRNRLSWGAPHNAYFRLKLKFQIWEVVFEKNQKVSKSGQKSFPQPALSIEPKISDLVGSYSKK